MLAGAAVFVAAVVIAILVTALQAAPASEAATRAAQLSAAQAEPDGQPSAAATGAPGAGAEAQTGTIYVHVIGEVLRPGVVEVKTGTRVESIIDAAGGATDAAVLASLNLAREAVDGEQILVPNAEQAAAAGGALSGASGGGVPDASAGGVAGGTGQGGLVNLNTADAALLETLPRVGPALAQRIIDWRESNGPFASVDQLLDVAGIGAKTLDGFRERVTI